MVNLIAMPYVTCRRRIRLHPQEMPESALTVLNSLHAGTESGALQLQHEDCVTVHQLLQEQLAAPAAAATWKQRCGEEFAWSPYFDGAKRLPLEKPVEPAAAAAEAPANGLANGVDGLKLR